MVRADTSVSPVICQSPLPKALARRTGGVDISEPLCYSMDEVRTFSNMDNDKAAKAVGTPEGFQLPLPLHVIPSLKYVTGGGGENERYDPATAHTRAGDPGYQTRLPSSCGLCQAEALAKASYTKSEGT